MRSSGRNEAGAGTFASHGCWSGRRCATVDIFAHIDTVAPDVITGTALANRRHGCMNARMLSAMNQCCLERLGSVRRSRFSCLFFKMVWAQLILTRKRS